jgi:hypothetical protein
MVSSWCYHGVIMVLSWCYHGVIMASLWCYFCHQKVLSLYAVSHGQGTLPATHIRDGVHTTCERLLSWCQYRDFVVLSLRDVGVIMVSSWYHHYDTYYSVFMVRPPSHPHMERGRRDLGIARSRTQKQMVTCRSVNKEFSALLEMQRKQKRQGKQDQTNSVKGKNAQAL